MSDHSQSSRQKFLKFAAAARASSYFLGVQPRTTSITIDTQADLILINGRIATQDERRSFAAAAAIKDGRFLAVGTEKEVMATRGDNTQVIDLRRCTVIPGLNDSHLHLIRGGLNYNLELRWDGVPSLADGLRMLKEQAERTPSPQWVRVVGGWSESQFAERRTRLCCTCTIALCSTMQLCALLATPKIRRKIAGEIQHDSNGNPTGMLIARPNTMILYATLAKEPKLPYGNTIFREVFCSQCFTAIA